MENNQNQDKKKTRNYVIVLSICVLCLIIIVFAVTYAYFAPRVEGTGKEWYLGAGVAKLKITGGKIEVPNALPIYEKDKERKAFSQEISITLSDDSTIDSCYQIDLDIDNIGSNLRNQYFKYEFFRKGETTPVKSGSFGDSSIVYTTKEINTGTEEEPILKNVTTATITLLENEYLSIAKIDNNIVEEDSSVDDTNTSIEETEEEPSNENPDDNITNPDDIAVEGGTEEETQKVIDVKDYILRIWFQYDEDNDQTSYLTGAAETRIFSAKIHAHGKTGKCKVNENVENQTTTE